jgi:hypothetical protein
MKVGKQKQKEEFFYILGYIPKLIIKIWQFGKKKFYETQRIWAIFSMKNPLCRSKFGKISPYCSGWKPN